MLLDNISIGDISVGDLSGMFSPEEEIVEDVVMRMPRYVTPLHATQALPRCNSEVTACFNWLRRVPFGPRRHSLLREAADFNKTLPLPLSLAML